MDKLKIAIAGGTIYLSVADIYEPDFEDGPLFNSEAELAAWCTTFGLQYESVMLNEVPHFKISKTA